MSLLVEHHPRLPGGTGAVEPLEMVVRYQLLLKSRNDIPWFVGAPLVDNSLVGEREATLASSAFPTNCNTCRAISCPGPGTWGRVWNISAIFSKYGLHLRLLLLLPLLLPLQACWRREERSLQSSQRMPTVATLSFPPRQANDCDQSSASYNNYSPIPTQKFTFCFPPSISLSPFSKPTPNSKVECQRTHSTLDIKPTANYKVHLCDKGIGIIRISHYGCNGRWTSISSSLLSTLLDLIWWSKPEQAAYYIIPSSQPVIHVAHQHHLQYQHQRWANNSVFE